MKFLFRTRFVYYKRLSSRHAFDPVAVSSSMKRGRKNHGALAIYLSVRNIAPCSLFTTAFNVVCRWLYQKMTRTFRLQLYPFISQACILHTCKILPVQRVILDFYPRIFYTASDSRAKLFFKMFASMSPPPWRTKAFRNIGRDILSRSLVLKRKVLLPKSYSNGMAKFGSCRYFL